MNGLKYDTKVDTWSATILICALLTGKLPFQGRSDKDVLEQIRYTDLEVYLEQFFPIEGTRRSNNHRQAVDFLV